MHEESSWALIAHGGAKDITPGEEQANRAGLIEAVGRGKEILAAGGSAVEAVEAVVKLLELNPAYNAGLYGAVTNEEGKIELDASIMDGRTLDIGAVACVQGFEHPVSIARKLLNERETFLVAAGAEKFALRQGFSQVAATPQPTNSPGCDTVGCVARDRDGNLAAATSTGGLRNTKAGRIGDVPLPGCGFYADNARGGVSASGDGEFIARTLLASEFLRRLETMDPDAATAETLTLLNRVGGEAGLIGIGSDGRIGWAHSSQHFAVGLANAQNPEPRAYLKKDEEDAKAD